MPGAAYPPHVRRMSAETRRAGPDQRAEPLVMDEPVHRLLARANFF